jgi:type IV secretion system protein VirD4
VVVNPSLLPLAAALLALGLVGLAGSYGARWLVAKPSTHGDSRWAGWRDRRRIGRLSPVNRLHPDGIVLGFWQGRVLQTPREDNALLFGVQRSGKTSTVVVPTLLSWRGAAVVTSTKHELLQLTAHHRRSLGPVHVFAPLEPPAGIASMGLSSVRWNPLATVSTAAAAAELAAVFTTAGRYESSPHWNLAAASLLTGLFLDGHRTGGDLRAVLRRLNQFAVAEYAGLATGSGDPAVREIVKAFANTPEKEAGSIASTARAALGLWLDERVAEATSSGGDQLDVDRLLSDGATLYLVAPAEDAERCRPLFSALVQTILRRATARARSIGGLLEPRLLLALDEVANFARLPNLAGYASTGPGQGIQTLLCFHDYAQVEAGYGAEPARTIWNNCRARVLLPGQSDLRTLELFSKSIGNETRTFQSSSSRDGTLSRQEQRIGHPLASPDFLRRLEEPVLLYASGPPARLTARRWDEVPRWRRLVERSSTQALGGASIPPAVAGPAGKGASA